MSIRIFVEGNDDNKFIVSLLNDLKRNSEIDVLDSINFNNYIDVMGSKSKLLDKSHTKYKRVSDKIGFEIKKALFIFDCDFEKDDKNLDYFLVETINKKECYEHFDKLVACLDVEKLKPNKKPIANLYRDLYPYPQFDFKDDRFQPLKDKLIDLFKGIK
jgi:hypothetical protein